MSRLSRWERRSTGGHTKKVLFRRWGRDPAVRGQHKGVQRAGFPQQMEERWSSQRCLQIFALARPFVVIEVAGAVDHRYVPVLRVESDRRCTEVIEGEPPCDLTHRCRVPGVTMGMLWASGAMGEESASGDGRK